MTKLKSLCVFCGSSASSSADFHNAAKALGELCARRGIKLVYGGASVGLMGMVADATLSSGGEVIGVLPQTLVDRELAHNGLTQLFVVESMAERKQLMFDHSDAFLALPGGYGTLDEMFEMLTWMQLGISERPCVFLNVDGYYDHLLSFLDRAVRDGLLRSDHRAASLVAVEPEEALAKLEAWQAPGAKYT